MTRYASGKKLQRTRQLLACGILCLSLVVTSPTSVQAEDASPKKAAASSSQLADAQFKKLIELAPNYDLRVPRSSDAFKLVEEPLLRWTNPIRAARDGGVFIWTHQGRPAAVMCAYWREGFKYDHEFQSLHELPFEARLNGETRWTPDDAGVTYRPIPDNPRVAGSRAARLAQMRSLAAKFDGSTGHVNKPKRPLRLLRQPLYRYPKDLEATNVVDGAVFALVQSTDPEIFIILEAREGNASTSIATPSSPVSTTPVNVRPNSPAGQKRWYVAFARMSVVAQFVKYNDRVFWKCNWGQPKRESSTYYTWHHDEPEGLVKKRGQP